MAKLVLGVATSHGPMLSTPWQQWGQRVEADKRSNELWFKGKQVTFDELVELRRDEKLESQITPEKMEARHTACQQAIDQLAEVVGRVKPDVCVIIGDDQRELFHDTNMPAMAVFWGEKFMNQAPTEEEMAKMPPGIAIAQWGHSPPEPMEISGEPDLARHMLSTLMDEEFDVSHFNQLPQGRHEHPSIPHAYGFVYRRIMHDNVPPNVPVFINTFYPPNQPTLRRSYKFGKTIGNAIRDWDSDKTVAVFASGGLTHFVVEEDVDEMVLNALREKDDDALMNMPRERFNSGTSEIRNWIALAGAMADGDLEMSLVDFQPCYRSIAGTGNAMGFAYWNGAN